jgi:hypothetical protein
MLRLCIAVENVSSRCRRPGLWLRGAVLPLAVRVPAYAIAESLGRPADHSLKVVASLQNQHRPRSPDIGCDLAEFIDAAPWTIQIVQIHRDSIDPALVAVNGEFNASLDLPPQFLVPADLARSNGNFHRCLLSCFGRVK